MWEAWQSPRAEISSGQLFYKVKLFRSPWHWGQLGRQPVLLRWDMKDMGGEGCHHRAEDGEHLEASPYGRHCVIPIPCMCTALHRVSQFAFIHIPSCDLHDTVTSSGWASYSHVIEERLFSMQAHKKGKGGHSWEQVSQSSIIHPHTFSLIAIILGWFITWGPSWWPWRIQNPLTL